VVRLACIDLPEFPLQLLLNRHPDWREYPAAVVSRDSPGGTILNVNIRARKEGVEPGLRYAAGLSLAPALRAGTVSQREIDEGGRSVLQSLHRFSPQVELCPEPGLFWLDATGLVPLYDSLQQWVDCIRSALATDGFSVAVAVGFSRFGSYAAAKTVALAGAWEGRGGVAEGTRGAGGEAAGGEVYDGEAASAGAVIFASRAEERRTAVRAPLVVLPLEPPILDRLRLLGIRRVGEFLELPSGGVRRRFGAEAERLHSFASGVLSDREPELPLQPEEPEQPAWLTTRLPVPSGETLRLLDATAGCLDSLLREAETRRDMVRELRLELKGEEGEMIAERITPAVPTRDRRLLLELIALRLESLRLPAPAAEVTLRSVCSRETTAQRELFVQRTAQARAAAAQAFARLRAVFGNEAVQWACPEDEHLPERSYRWENLEHLSEPAAASSGVAGATEALDPSAPSPFPSPLVRRIFRSPQPLPDSRAPIGPFAAHPPDPVRSPSPGDGSPRHSRSPAGGSAFHRLWGPYLLSGHWWEWEVAREYYYAEDEAGVLLWLYRDRHTRRWWIAGRVE
jgi:protein ImuB